MTANLRFSSNTNRVRFQVHEPDRDGVGTHGSSQVFEIVHLENPSSRGLCYTIGCPHTAHEEVGNIAQVTFSRKRFENLEKSFRCFVAVVYEGIKWRGDNF